MPMIPGSAGAGLGLAGEIKSAVASNNPDLAALWTSDTNMDWLFDSIATAVIAHLKENMQVVVFNAPTTSVPPTFPVGTTASPPGAIT